MKKIIAVHAGPRAGWNTDRLVLEAARGAEEAGAEVETVELYRLGSFRGCVSCFSCKRPQSFGKCAFQDDLTPVLDRIREADGLIVGSPNYLGNLTAGFRALYERLVFQSLTYNREQPCCNDRSIPVLLITTSNCAESAYEAAGYDRMLEQYRGTLQRFVGPTEILVCGDTLQVRDYSQYNWTAFDPEAKQRRHDETFGDYLRRAYELGKAL